MSCPYIVIYKKQFEELFYPKRHFYKEILQEYLSGHPNTDPEELTFLMFSFHDISVKDFMKEPQNSRNRGINNLSPKFILGPIGEII